MFIIRLAQLVIVGVLVYAAYRVFHRLMGQGGLKGMTGAGKIGRGIDDVMIKDPYCQAYFPKGQGVALRQGGKELYFCSEECRDKYIRGNGS